MSAEQVRISIGPRVFTVEGVKAGERGVLSWENEKAPIVLLDVGDGGDAWPMRPDDARSFARELLRQADEADGGF